MQNTNDLNSLEDALNHLPDETKDSTLETEFDLDDALAELPREHFQPADLTPVKRAPVRKSSPKPNHQSKPRGKMLISKILTIASGLFIIALLILNIIPYKFLIPLILIIILFAVYVHVSCRKYRRKGGLKAFSLLLACLYLVGAFYAIKFFMVIGDITKDNIAPDINVASESYTMYISGIDTYGEISASSRSDVNMLMVMNPNSHHMLLVNTPRDYYVDLPGISGGQYDKLTHAGNYGVEASMAALSQLYDEPVEFYTRLNFSSLIDIVDALGGITVESELSFTTGEDSGAIVDIIEGKNHLDGIEALAFSRERQAFEDGDNQRGKNQQLVINGIFKRVLSPRVILGANQILNTIGQNTEINMSRSQVQGFIRSYLDGAFQWNTDSVSATGYGSTEYCFSAPDQPLSVVIPDPDSVTGITQLINSTKEVL